VHASPWVKTHGYLQGTAPRCGQADDLPNPATGLMSPGVRRLPSAATGWSGLPAGSWRHGRSRNLRDAWHTKLQLTEIHAAAAC